jgi:hypothetical protein
MLMFEVWSGDKKRPHSGGEPKGPRRREIWLHHTISFGGPGRHRKSRPRRIMPTTEQKKAALQAEKRYVETVFDRRIRGRGRAVARLVPSAASEVFLVMA